MTRLTSSEIQQPALRIDPARTAALVVGVQGYPTLGDQIPGVLEDALGFARWLNQGHCVPRDQIYLVLSPLAASRREEEPTAGPVFLKRTYQHFQA